jgi:ferredoxin
MPNAGRPSGLPVDGCRKSLTARTIADTTSGENTTITKEIIMKVTISKECMGDRNCNKLCPEVFEYDEEQLLSIVKYDEIPAHLHDIVRRAAAECGANAITVEE